MSNNIEKIIYINLNKRTDRRVEIESELDGFELQYERFEAIEREPGILGCLISHLSVLEIAKERGYKNILILEDDFQFLTSKETFEEELKKLFDSEIDFDVCFLETGIYESEEVENCNFLRRVIRSTSAPAYIVNYHYYDELINLYKWALPLLENTGYHWLYANDKCWEPLQKRDNWFYFNKRIGKQRPGYSDNSKSYVDYC